MVTVADAWRTAYPEAHAGLLLMHAVDNPASQPELERVKQRLEAQLRARFAGQDRHALESSTLAAYAAYYKRFKKTYHVQAQLESIVFKGRADRVARCHGPEPPGGGWGEGMISAHWSGLPRQVHGRARPVF
jgi:hypothetical protein